MRQFVKFLLVVFVMVLGVLACEDNAEDTRPISFDPFENDVEFRDTIRFDTDPGEDPGGGGSDTTKVRN